MPIAARDDQRRDGTVDRGIENNDYASDEATMLVHRDCLRTFRETFDSVGRHGPLLADALTAFEDACDAGKDELDIAALVTMEQASRRRRTHLCPPSSSGT